MHKYLYSYNITLLYMFRALLCSSSGGSIVYVQHLVPSFSVSGRALHWLRENCSLLTSVMYSRSQRVMVPDAVHIQLNLLKMSIMMPETCRGYYMNKDICALSCILCLLSARKADPGGHAD